MRIDNWTIGSDFEVFIQDSNTKKLISAAGDESTHFLPRIPGTKYDPFYIDDAKQFAYEVDNVSAEMLIPPCKDAVTFRKNIRYIMNYLEGKLHAGYKLLPIASATFDLDQLLTETATTFGCDRDMNAWTKDFNPRPDTNTMLRSNGFHIHIGYDKPNLATSIELIKAMDIYVGVGSLFADFDTDRRKLYGKAGSFRIKEYGVEYRTLSSAMLQTDELIEWAFNATISAINSVNNGQKVKVGEGKLVQEAINNNNMKVARQLYNVPEPSQTVTA